VGDGAGMARPVLGRLGWARGQRGWGECEGQNPHERETIRDIYERERDGLAHMSPNFWRAVEAELFLAIGRK
jgi:hypothetical protein